MLGGCGGHHGTTTSTTATTTTSTTPPPLPEPAGVNAGPMFLEPDRYSPADVDRLVAGAAAAGVRLMRSDALWELTERAPPQDGRHTYDWGLDDLTVGTLARHGIRWWALVDYSAGWAAQQPGVLHSPPRDPATYAAFAAALARRYGPDGDFWRAHPGLPRLPVVSYEIWNEPDLGAFWPPKPDPAAYAALYAAAGTAIHAVQPGAGVFTGGLSYDTSFVPAMLAARPDLAGGGIDGVAVHRYAPTPAAVRAKVAAHRAALDGAGLGALPLAVTEVGWQSQLPHDRHYAAPADRPRYVAALVPGLLGSGCGVVAVLPYAWMSDRAGSRPDQWLGLVGPEGASTPAARALARGLDAQGQRPSARSACR